MKTFLDIVLNIGKLVIALAILYLVFVFAVIHWEKKPGDEYRKKRGLSKQDEFDEQELNQRSAQAMAESMRKETMRKDGHPTHEIDNYGTNHQHTLLY